MAHLSVLLHESIDGLNIQVGDIVVDGTLGGGGHSEEIARRFGDSVRIIGLDMDAAALERTKKRLTLLKTPFSLHNESFRYMDKVIEKEGIKKVNRILLDIGLSSNQFEESGRGFSFKKDEPLLMTFKELPDESDLTAKEIVNTWEEENIADILYGYGEERYSRQIAKAIVTARKERPIQTTSDLVEIILKATPKSYHHRKIHPATKTFQALRITVNDEIGSLRDGLAKGWATLERSGRIAVISFHSLEDRVVKNFIRDRSKAKEGIAITKKPMVPSQEEVERNPRARSAKLRIVEKII